MALPREDAAVQSTEHDFDQDHAILAGIWDLLEQDRVCIGRIDGLGLVLEKGAHDFDRFGLM